MTIFDGIVMIIFIIIATGLGIFFVLEKRKDKKANGANSPKIENSKNNEDKSNTSLDTENVLDFMKFDKIQDNMIELENGTKYVMVLQCQGINYYLMSENEKLAVEQGFIQLLNALRHKIQFYIQTRRVDLRTSVNEYHKQIETLEEEILKINSQIDLLDEEDAITRKNLKWELTKKERLLDYVKDITQSVEKINSNKNVLQRKFYVVIPYYANELGFSNKFTDEEKKDIAYNELYTRATSIASAFNSCSVESRILDSNDLGELLYMAYNRDEANIVDFRKTMENGFYKLYSTSKDVLQKKQEMYQAKIKDEAMQKAQAAVKRAITDIMQEESIKEVFSKEVLKQAEMIIENSRSNYSDKVINKALDDIKGKKKNTSSKATNLSDKQPKKTKNERKKVTKEV